MGCASSKDRDIYTVTGDDGETRKKKKGKRSGGGGGGYSGGMAGL